MNIQDVLAANVQAIIDASGMNENSFAAHFKLPKSNLRKMRLSEANMRMSTVEEVAVALRLRACDLLDPDLARQHLAKLCFQQQATITPKTKDRYGRTVADVQCQGQDVATEQVRAGLAWYYVRYGKGYEHLGALQSSAQAVRSGLWSTDAIAPWDWRARH